MIVSCQYFKFILYVAKRTPCLRITIVVIQGKFSLYIFHCNKESIGKYDY